MIDLSYSIDDVANMVKHLHKEHIATMSVMPNYSGEWELLIHGDLDKLINLLGDPSNVRYAVNRAPTIHLFWETLSGLVLTAVVDASSAGRFMQ